MKPLILIIDDTLDFREAYRDMLGDLGYDVQTSASRAEALQRLEQERGWDVILLDEKLSGPGGPSTAASMLQEISSLAPAACTIVITAYMAPKTMRAAIASGAWDYLQKDEFLEIILPLRVTHAIEAARDRKIRATSPESLEKDLRSTWAEAQQRDLDANVKGRRLEQTLALLFHTLPGLTGVKTNLRNDVEELDLVIANESTDPILQKEGSFILVECKNWSRPVGPEVTAYFEKKLEQRFGRVKLGILIATSGFTAGVDVKLARTANKDMLMILLDASDLSAWIETSDRVGWLKDRILKASMRA